jgi:uncharacterized protein YidB (DUF937 family)
MARENGAMRGDNMGIFDQILGGITADTTQHSVLFDEVGQLVSKAGGVSGLAQQFEQNGLGGIMSGWIGTGTNPPISGEQVLQALGRDDILAIAAKADLSEAQVTAGISQLLPLVINHLTPNGTTANHTPEELQGALGDLKSKLVSS